MSRDVQSRTLCFIRAAAATIPWVLVQASTPARAADCDGDGTDDSLQTYFWQGIAPGFWNTPDNWFSANGGPPTLTSLAVFDADSGLGHPPYTVTLASSRSVFGLHILNGLTTVDLSGQTLDVTGLLPFCRELLIGGPIDAELDITRGGLFSTKAVRIGDTPGAAATLRIDGAAAALTYRHLSPVPLIVGDVGDGVLELDTALFRHDGRLVIGQADGVQGKLTAVGTSQIDLSAEVFSQVVIGSAGRGLFQLQNGSTFVNMDPASMILGELPTGEGTLDFYQCTQPNNVPLTELHVGLLGKGLLNVRLGSALTTFVSTRLALGVSESADGEARVIAGGSWKTIGASIEIAPLGSGRLVVGETGTVDADNGTIAYVDGVIEGSGMISGNVLLPGGEIAPNGQFADTSARQQLHFSGDLAFSAPNPTTGLHETGRMTFTILSNDPSQTMSAVVAGAVFVDGTLRVRVLPGMTPPEGTLFPAIEAPSASGVFDAVQGPLIDGIVAEPVYPGDGNVYVKFTDRGVPPSNLEAPLGFAVPGTFTDGKVVDINNDGFPDLVALNDNGPGVPGEVVVAANLGVDAQGQWLGFSPATATFSTIGDRPVSLDIGDLNADGHPDIVLMNAGPATDQIRIRLNNQFGDFSNVDNRSISIDGTPIDLVLGDINGDERLDVISIFRRAILRGTGNGAIQTSEDNGSGFDDADGDTGDDPGSVDTMGGATPSGVVVTSNGENSSYIYSTSNVNTSTITDRGTGILPLFLAQIVPTGRDPANVYTADIDGDGLDDIITSDRLSGTISVVRAVSTGQGEIVYDDAVSLKANEAGALSMPGAVVAADVNGDGTRDLVFSATALSGDTGVWAILNLGLDDQNGMLFAEAGRLPGDDTVGTAPLGLAVADVDQNGSEDIVVFRTQGSGPAVTVQLSPGDPPCNAADLAAPFGVLDLQDLAAFISAFVAGDPIADINSDGLLDLADINTFIAAFLAGCP